MTIDTSREAVERLLARAEAAEAECVKMLNEQDHDYNRKTNDLIERHAGQITFLLAERDAALAEVARLSTPPDHLALVAAAYRDAAEQCVDPDGGESCGDTFDLGYEAACMENETAILARTPADAEAHLTALLRAEYERGVREAATRIADTCPHADVPGGNCTPDTFDEGTSAAYEAVLALLTQEGR